MGVIEWTAVASHRIDKTNGLEANKCWSETPILIFDLELTDCLRLAGLRRGGQKSP